MSYYKKSVPSFKFVGMPLRTTYKDGRDKEDLGPFWQKFFSENVKERIQDKVDPAIVYGVYTDYTPDGYYTFLAGYEVKDFTMVDSELLPKTIPTQTYAVFTARGPVEFAIADTWKEIWSSDIKRAFTYDFERYTAESLGANSVTEIYVAIK